MIPAQNLWTQKGMPHRGWRYVDCIDSGDLDEQCEFCGNDIRYIHYISHPDVDGTAGVGCVCAESLTQDYVTPRERHKAVVATTRRLKINWRESPKGHTAKYRGYRLTAFQQGKHWKVVVDGVFSTKSVDTLEEAHLLAEAMYREIKKKTP